MSIHHFRHRRNHIKLLLEHPVHHCPLEYCHRLPRPIHHPRLLQMDWLPFWRFHFCNEGKNDIAIVSSMSVCDKLLLQCTYVIVEFRLFGEVDVLCEDELFDLGESSLFTRTDVVLIAVFTLFRLGCGGGYS